MHCGQALLCHRPHSCFTKLEELAQGLDLNKGSEPFNCLWLANPCENLKRSPSSPEMLAAQVFQAHLAERAKKRFGEVGRDPE